MLVKFQCKKCGKRFKVDVKLAGKEGRCPCGNKIRIPTDNVEDRSGSTKRSELGSDADALENTEICRRIKPVCKEGEHKGTVFSIGLIFMGASIALGVASCLMILNINTWEYAFYMEMTGETYSIGESLPTFVGAPIGRPFTVTVTHESARNILSGDPGPKKPGIYHFDSSGRIDSTALGPFYFVFKWSLLIVCPIFFVLGSILFIRKFIWDAPYFRRTKWYQY